MDGTLLLPDHQLGQQTLDNLQALYLRGVNLAQAGQGFIMGNAMGQQKAALPYLPVLKHCGTQAVSHYLNHWLATPDPAYSPEC